MRIKSLADDKNKNASLVLKLIEEKTQMLSAILIGNNVCELICFFSDNNLRNETCKKFRYE